MQTRLPLIGEIEIALTVKRQIVDAFETFAMKLLSEEIYEQ